MKKTEQGTLFCGQRGTPIVEQKRIGYQDIAADVQPALAARNRTQAVDLDGAVGKDTPTFTGGNLSALKDKISPTVM
jgi:hypothetical protein